MKRTLQQIHLINHLANGEKRLNIG